MEAIRLDDLQRDPAQYLRRIRAGETFIIMEADKPIAEIKPVTARAKTRRPFGLCAGEFSVPEDFDTPLPDEIVRLLEGK